MRAWVVDGGFGLDKLTVVERPVPVPGPGQVRLELLAASLNYRDLLMVTGRYDPRQRLPLVPCSDGVGRVVEVGPGVTDVKVGDRVSPIFAQAWLGGEVTAKMTGATLGGPLDGTLQQQLVVPAASVVAVPDHLSDVEAACLPCAAVTAWRSLVTEGGVTAGSTVLTLGTGGVSCFVIQLGKLLGATVIVTSSSPERLARAKALGADHGVDYTADPQWGRTVVGLTGGRGVDVVVELGGAGTLDQSLRAVRPGGRIALVGNLAGLDASLSLAKVFMRGIRLQGILVGSREDHVALLRALVAAPTVRPLVDRIYAWDEVPEAFAQLARGGHMGKLAVQVAS